MCHGNADLKHLMRETEARLAHLPKGDGVPTVGVLARLRVLLRWRPLFAKRA
jgi:hypothetical protein